MAKKIPAQTCLENYERLCRLFRRSAPEQSHFHIVYGCAVEVTMADFRTRMKSSHAYKSYLIGYEPESLELVVLPIGNDFHALGDPVPLRRSEVAKARLGPLSGEITLRNKKLPEGCVRFLVPERIDRDKHNVLVPVKQEEAARAFTAFFKTRYLAWRKDPQARRILIRPEGRSARSYGNWKFTEL